MKYKALIATGSVTCCAMMLGGVVAAAPAQAANNPRVLLLVVNYENPPGSVIKFDCMASPQLVGKTAKLREVGGTFQKSAKIKKNGTCNLTGTSSVMGKHYFQVVVKYRNANGKLKKVKSAAESVYIGTET